MTGGGKNVWLRNKLTCFLNSSACGANAVGSASLTNCITSSMDQEEGFLLGCAPSRSDTRDSGPVVELAAGQAQHTRSNCVRNEVFR